MTPRVSIPWLALFLLANGALAGSALAGGTEKAPAAAGSCVKVTTEVRYRNYAYDHIVNLKNECKRAATCTVKTDVNPAPVTVELAVKEEQSVVTFSGSPSREFHEDVSCKEHD